MSATQGNTTTLEKTQLPPGIRHYQTVGFAENRAAYDALSPEDGWREVRRPQTGSTWKEKPLDEGRLTVHAPSPSMQIPADVILPTGRGLGVVS